MQVFDQGAVSGQVYTMVKNERMGGFVPSYGGSESVQSADASGEQSGDFSFFDLVDMVNPLQHIPVLNLAYRAITGDEIKPISQIIGGAAYGGFAGAASGLVNAIVEEETGDNIGGHIASFAFGRDRPTPPDLIDQEQIAYDDLPVTLLSFAQAPLPISDDVA